MRAHTVLLAMLVALCLLALATPSSALCTCKDKGVSANPCNFNAHVCGCLKGLKWKYKCNVKSKSTGTSVDYSWTKSGEGCAKEALFRVFNKMEGANECNCQQSGLPFGSCTLTSRVCFHFKDTGGMERSQPVFKAFVYGPAGGSQVGSVAAMASPEDAVKAGIQGLLGKFPGLVAQCGVPMLQAGQEPEIQLPAFDFQLPAVDMDGDEYVAEDQLAIAME